MTLESREHAGVQSLYLAGPMSGYDDHNFPAFHAAARKLRDVGYRIVNPAELDGDPPAEVTRADWCSYLRRDLPLMLGCDGVATLPGWQHSSGARLETDVASRVDMPVLPWEAWIIGADRLLATSTPASLVGLVGYAQAGKDTVAAELVARHGWTRVAFADELKRVALDANPLLTDYWRLADEVESVGWDEAKQASEVRGFLQRLGVGARRHIHTDVWVQAGLRQVDAVDGPVVVTDVRFPNEVQAIRDRGGIIVEVRRPGTGAANDHVSERLAGEAHRIATYTLHNDADLEAVRWKVGAMVDGLGLATTETADA